MGIKIYTSAAGSGKTFTLVKEYLTLLFNNESYSGVRQILALTFTNKAANEMKERIIHSLHEFTHLSPNEKHDLLDAILINLPNQSPQKIKEKSKFLLEEILFRYYNFSVSTIDKFNQKLIRTFSSELELNQNYEVVLESQALLKEAIENVLNQSRNDKALAKFLKEFIQFQIEEDKSWNIKDLLFKFSNTLLNEDAKSFVEQLQLINLDEISTQIARYRAYLKTVETKIQDWGKEAVAIMDEHGIVSDDFNGKSRGLGSYFEKCVSLKAGLPEPSATIAKTMASGDYFHPKLSAERRSYLDQNCAEFPIIYDQIIEYLGEQLQQYTLTSILLKNIHSLALLVAIDSAFKTLTKERGLLLIGEFNHLLSDLIANEPAPFIYERLGNRFQHFLIDEFQDTSQLQWHNLVPLFEEGISKGGTGLIVGDGKQAIYRWRGGSVTQFANPFETSKKSLLSERMSVLKSQSEIHQLASNYRSFGTVVQFNNDLFSEIALQGEGLVEEIYRSASQSIIKKPNEGYVRIERMPSDLEETYHEWNLIRVLDQVKELVLSGYEYGEIAILTRKNAQISAIAPILLDHNIPVVTQEALLVANDNWVQLLHTLLKIATDPKNNTHRLRVLFILQNLNIVDTHLHEPLISIADEKTGLVALHKLLGEIGIKISFSKLNTLPIYEKIRYILSAFSLSAPNPFLDTYLNHIYSGIGKVELTLSEILDQLDEKMKKLSIELPDGPNAVRLMTIHKSKGLEFPAVILPFADNYLNKENYIWVNLDQEKYGIPVAWMNSVQALLKTELAEAYQSEVENKRLDEINSFYVGFTRAIETLIVFTSDKSNGNYSFFYIDKALSNLSGWDDNNKVFTRGELNSERVSKKKKPEAAITSSGYYVTPTSDLVELQKVDIPSTNGIDVERQYGILLHEVFSRLNSFEHAENLIKEHFSHLPENIKSNILKDILAAAKTKQLQAFFDPNANIRNEVKMIEPNGSILRPDRVLIQDNTAKILDYKTGKKLNKDHTQVTLYKAALQNMGYKNVQGFIYYTQHQELVEV
ncbi:MAG: UvrD-helicase domain-containing protein [Flavobacteriales bacterium]|nr:UvrD-helicase domain-containing protein [Flavobacteriales bacterium]